MLLQISEPTTFEGVLKDRLAYNWAVWDYVSYFSYSAETIPTALTALAGRNLHRYLELLVVRLLVLEGQHEDDDTLKNSRAPYRILDAIFEVTEPAI